MISDEAVDAAIYAYGVDGKAHGWERKMILAILEAAAPHMLSHERQQTADAHRDAIVNRDTADRLERELQHAKADAWDEGFDRGFYDPLAGRDRDASESRVTNPYRSQA